MNSTYVTVRDGVKLAVDIFRPTRKGMITEEPLPVIWMHSPYNRRPKGGVSEAEDYPSGPISLVKYGYVVAVADFRGLYASFGKTELYNFGEYAPTAWMDAYDVTEWLAKQPWSTGKIGMWGCSATGGSQLQAAATRPPSLKAIFPLSPNFDAYEFAHFGGAPWSLPAMAGKAAVRDAKASPVDGPGGPVLLAQAAAGHIDDVDDQRLLEFRDSPSQKLGPDWWAHSGPAGHLAELNRSGVAVYTGGNWDELATKIAPAELFANLPHGRAKLLFGPHAHCGWGDTASKEGFSIRVEQRRFFDYWLKGIDNGVMSEPAVAYYTYNAPAGKEWRQSTTWPLPNEKRAKYYLKPGALDLRPAASSGREQTAMGPPAEVSPILLRQPDGGLTYETSPLKLSVEVTGYPVADLWVSADSADTDVVAEMDDVSPDGEVISHQMVGRLRASRRKLSKAPFNTFGLPYHSQLGTDAQPLPDKAPAELKFAMTPMSYIFPAGHRIRVRLTFSNTAPGQPAKATVWSGPATPSSIDLPIIPN